jgi:hypothetical protein
VGHLGHLAAPHRQQLGDDADVFFRDVDQQQLDRLVHDALDVLRHHRGLGDLHLVPLAPHGLDEDGELQLATTGDAQRVGRVGVLDANADVAPLLLRESLPQLARGDVGALAPRPRRGVGGEDHRDRRFIDANGGEGARVLAVGDGVADVDFLDAGHGHDVAGFGALGLDALEAAPGEQLNDLDRALRAVGRAEDVRGA